MATEKRLIDANAIPWEEHYVPDPNSEKQWEYKKELCVLKSTVDAMPTVDAVEVVHGRWEPHPDAGGFERCSVCHDCIIYDDWVDEPKWYYCPNCGAKMDGGADCDGKRSH